MNAVPPLVDGVLVSVTFARLATAPTDAVGCSTSGPALSWLERNVPRGRGAEGGGCAVAGSDLELVFVEPLFPPDDSLCVVGRCAIGERNEFHDDVTPQLHVQLCDPSSLNFPSSYREDNEVLNRAHKYCRI